MNIRKVIKYITGIGVVSAISYLSYKLGESNGAENERFRIKYYEDFNDYEDLAFKYTEPDDGCVAPNKKQKSL